MSYKAKENFLWFTKGQIVEEIQDNWKPYFEEVSATKLESKPEEKNKSFKKRTVTKR